MTTFWGVDLGVRSYSAAGIRPDGTLVLHQLEQKVKGKISAQPPEARAIELASVRVAIESHTLPGDVALVEEPPSAGSRNVRTFLKLSQTSAAAAVGLVAGGADVGFVPVETWKKGTIGRGGVDKDTVARWLERVYPGYHAQCAGDQNLIDATCIAIYCRTWRLGEAAARVLDQVRDGLAAS